MALALKSGNQFNSQEIIIERPDRTRVTVLAHANPLRDESGAISCAVNVLIDISDRKQAEQAQARLAAIVESSEDAIVGNHSTAVFFLGMLVLSDCLVTRPKRRSATASPW
jgi:PAS domain-containing protein